MTVNEFEIYHLISLLLFCGLNTFIFLIFHY